MASTSQPQPEKPESEPAGSTVELSDREEEDVAQRMPPSAAVVFETVRREGESELERAPVSLFASGLAAGLAMGMSMAAEGLIRARLPDAKWAPLVASAGYSVGFLIVVLGRQQLFTENTLTAILPLLDSPKKTETFVKVARLWALVLVANIIGAGIFAFVAADTNAFSEEARKTFLTIGHEAFAPGFGSIVLRGIFAGWLIALMVWLLPGAEQTRLFVVLIITYVVGLAGMSHVIAGSVEVMYVVARGELSWSQYAGSYLLPVLVGNIVGGVSLVALLNYGQVVADADHRKSTS